MNLVPLYNKVIVEIIPENSENKTASGLVIMNRPDPFVRGKVVGVGNGSYQNAQRIPMDVKVGDVIRILKNTGMGVSFDVAGTPTKLICADNDIFAIEGE